MTRGKVADLMDAPPASRISSRWSSDSRPQASPPPLREHEGRRLHLLYGTTIANPSIARGDRQELAVEGRIEEVAGLGN